VWILNEVWSPTTGAQIEARFEALFPGTAWTAVHRNPQEGVVVATRFPVLESAIFDVTTRDYVAVRLDARPLFDTDLVVVGNHWKCCTAAGDDAKRQNQADGLIGSLRSVRAGTLMNVSPGTPVIAGGDLNLVGLERQLTTLVTGDILDNATWGPDSPPDWDGSDFDVVWARHPDHRFVYTWRNDSGTFYPGKLDWIVYTGSGLSLENSVVLDTRSMSNDSLAAHGLLATDTPTASDHAPIVADFIVRNQVGVREEQLPVRRLLGPVSPNPFASSTTLRFTLPAKAEVDLVVFDASGRAVRRLAQGTRPAGEHAVTWDGRDDAGRSAPAGVYLCRLRTAGVEEALRLVLLR
jgi:endonuclease/exonuclease/phosphatase family metal-dependent hydrolase